MEKIFDLGVESYVACKKQVPLQLTDYIVLFISTIVDIVKFSVLSFPCWIESIFYLFVSRPKKNVAGQVVLITGAGNGIGKAMALRFARNQCKIAVVDIEENAAKQTAKEIVEKGGKAVAYRVDISDYDAIEKLRVQVENDLGPVDILVNNAAILPLLSFRKGTHKEVQRIADVNITANYIITRVFLKEMERRRTGHIVTMSSLAAYYPAAGTILYTSSKFAMLGFSEALSEELRQDGLGDCIHVTSVHPYFVATRADFMKLLKLRFPAISPEQCANTIVDGVLRNQLHVIVPAYNRIVVEIFRLLPYKVQHLARDILAKESEMGAAAKARANIVFK